MPTSKPHSLEAPPSAGLSEMAPSLSMNAAARPLALSARARSASSAVGLRSAPAGPARARVAVRVRAEVPASNPAPTAANVIGSAETVASKTLNTCGPAFATVQENKARNMPSPVHWDLFAADHDASGTRMSPALASGELEGIGQPERRPSYCRRTPAA